MVENNKEELSTEQILSSIRDILTGEDGKLNVKKDEDVLELTADMVVSRPDSASRPQLNSSSETIAANIIKNFSSKFSYLNSDSHRVKQSDQRQDEVLRASVSKAVEDWVMKNIKSDFELQKTVRDEVARQVTQWLEGNLVGLVSSSIKQEIDRAL